MIIKDILEEKISMKFNVYAYKEREQKNTVYGIIYLLIQIFSSVSQGDICLLNV